MRAFIVYVKGSSLSEQYASKCKQSFKNHSGWAPEWFEGITASTLKQHKTFEHKEPSFAGKTLSKGSKQIYLSKKACAHNHYRLFKICVELKEPIAIIEHDSYCIGDWNNYDFDDILVLNIASAIRDGIRDVHRRRNENTIVNTGIHDINLTRLNYYWDPKIQGHMMPGTAAYAVTPKGAQKMITVFEEHGWDQSDAIINTAFVRIQTIMPELFTFQLPNLRMSRGENMA